MILLNLSAILIIGVTVSKDYLINLNNSDRSNQLFGTSNSEHDFNIIFTTYFFQINLSELQCKSIIFTCFFITNLENGKIIITIVQ